MKLEVEIITTVPDVHKQYELVQYHRTGLWIRESNAKVFNTWSKNLGVYDYTHAEIIGHVESDKGNFKIKIII